MFFYPPCLPTGPPSSSQHTLVMNTGAPREPVAAACRCVAWMLSTALVFLFVVVCSLPTGCGAFGTSPRLDTKLRRLHRAPKRRRPAAVQAHSNGCNAEGEKEEKELRLLTWIEVEARIKREVAEVWSDMVVLCCWRCSCVLSWLSCATLLTYIQQKVLVGRLIPQC